MTKHLILALLTVLFGLNSCTDKQGHQLFSPDGSLSVVISSDETGSLNYEVLKKTGSRTIPVILPSPLGLIRENQDFSAGLTIRSAGLLENIDESYTLLHGKRRECHNLANQQIFQLKNGEGQKMDLILRAYNDGIALRYRFPDKDSTMFRMNEEHTGFRIPHGARAFMQPHADAYPSYEQYYLADIESGTASPNKAGWSFPALFQLEGDGPWIMLTEAGLDWSYCGTRLRQEAPGGLYKIRFPDEDEGNGEGDVLPASTLPWATPWRVIMAGETPAEIIESSLITHLAPAPETRNTDWIKAGRASWSWWSEGRSTRDYNKLLSFIDLAAEFEWEYSLVDAGWHTLGKEKMRDLVEYGKERSVGIILWYHSGGHPRMQDYIMMKDKAWRLEEFRWLQEIGIAGIKTDFFLSDKQLCIKQYIDILEEAQEHNLMVNFHGCTLPRGWQRTYPNLMTMEAVKGEEMYKAHDHYPENAPMQNTIWPFTRNVMGPMDYTPTGFSDNRYPHLTTCAHELALPVIYESAWTHFIDGVESYQQLPEDVRDFLAAVPAAWDDIKFLSGYPGKYIVLARRSGRDWYIGGINGEEAPREVDIDLSFLGEGEFEQVLYSDGDTGRDISTGKSRVDASEKLKVSMPGYGGIAAMISPG